MWFRGFKNKEYKFEDKPRPGRPVTEKTEFNAERVRREIKKNRKITIRKLSSSTGIKRNPIREIILRKLGGKELSQIKHPHKLNDVLKLERLEWCKKMLRFFQDEAFKDL